MTRTTTPVAAMGAETGRRGGVTGVAFPNPEFVLHHLFDNAEIITTPHGPVLVLPTRWALVDDIIAMFGAGEDMGPNGDEEPDSDDELGAGEEDAWWLGAREFGR